MSVLAYIEARKDALASRAGAALEEIEREAEARQHAIAAMFGKASEPTVKDEEETGEKTMLSHSSGGESAHPLWRPLCPSPGGVATRA